MLLAGCDSTVNDPASEHSIGAVNFSNLATGQESWYTGFTGGSIYEPDHATFHYVQDTLVLRVSGTMESGFLFTEHFRAGSVSLKNDSFLWQDSVSYRVDLQEDTLMVRALDNGTLRSNLFMTDNSPLPLQPVQTNEMQLDGVITTSQTHDLYQIGFVQNHSQFDHPFDHLNILVDRTATVVDGPGFTLLYSEKDGLVRSFYTSVWTGTAAGWDLLPGQPLDLRQID